jgi:hypothetical protein
MRSSRYFLSAAVAAAGEESVVVVDGPPHAAVDISAIKNTNLVPMWVVYNSTCSRWTAT